MFLIDSYRYADAGGGATSYADVVLADSPVGYWRLGESSGTTAADSSGNGYDGTYVNSPTLGVTGLIAGDVDTAVEFDDDSNNYVDLDAHVSNWEAYTAGSIEGWIELVDDTVDATIFNAGRTSNDRMWLAYRSTGLVQFFFKEGVGNDILIQSDDALVAGVVYHIVATQDGTTPRLYIDGVEQTVRAQTTSGFWFGTWSDMLSANIGRLEESSLYSDAIIDEVALYDYALSSTRIAAHYNAGT